VLAVVICTGLACGTLLAAVGLALWGGFRQVPGLSHAMRAIGWLAGGFLLIGALLAWQGDHGLSAPALRLTLMAALAALPEIHRHPRSSWGNLMLILPALILAWAGLFWTSEPSGAGMGSPPVALVELAVIICGGLGARALGEALSEIAALPSPPKVGGTEGGLEWPSAAAYALLTLLVGGTALVNLWQRGTMWIGTTGEGGLAGVWLVWSAGWLAPRQPLRLRAVLITVAALLLIALVAGY